MTSQTIMRTVNELKKSLAKELATAPSDETSNNLFLFNPCLDLLKRLDELPIDIHILKETLVGTVVTKCKANTNRVIASTARALVKKWKRQAQQQSCIGANMMTTTTTMTTTFIDLRNKYRPITDDPDIFAWFRNLKNVYCGRPNIYRKKILITDGSFNYKPVSPSEVDCKVGKDGNLDTVLTKYRDYINNTNTVLKNDIHELQGKVLGCWCVGKHACHAQILAELANNCEVNAEGDIISTSQDYAVTQIKPDEELKSIRKCKEEA